MPAPNLSTRPERVLRVRQAPGTRHTSCMHSLEHACRVRRSADVAYCGGELSRVDGGCAAAVVVGGRMLGQ